jgi:TolB-like protein/DNA-binding winged helix-turn-helix (wHTH) protein/tetratricopeptide (TPR) repeat protein
VKTSSPVPPTLRFGVFELDPRTGELRKKGMKIRLLGQPVDILAMLLERPGETITREELQKKLWPADTFVDFEQGLNSAMKRLRAALDDDAESPHFIETVPRRGYRFIGAVNGGPGNGAEPTALADAMPDAGDKPAHHLRIGTRLAAVGLLGLTVAAALLLGMNVRGWRDRLFSGAPKPQIQALAVLPLANLSGDPEQEYFADGMTEALITELGKVSKPRVISRQSIMQYRGSKKPLQEIAKELRVDAVLEGAVERSGDRVRVTVRLNQVSPETQLWANEYNGGVGDLVRLEDEIARAIADGIQVKLKRPEQAHLASARTVDPEVQDAYLRGRFFWNRAEYFASHEVLEDVGRARPARRAQVPAGAHNGTTGAFSRDRTELELDLQTAIGYFKRAIEKDPDYALAYAGLADAYIALGNPDGGGHYPKETLPEAKAAATKASELDPSLGEAHFSLAQTMELYDWNWSEAEKEYRLALELNPNYADAHLEYGRFLQALGRNDEATAQMNYAVELDPLNLKTMGVVGYVTYASGQYDLAIEQFSGLGDDFGLGWAYREKKMYPEAIAALERSLSRSGRHELPLASLAGVYGLAGRRGEALKLIDELKARARRHYISDFRFAEAYTGLGEKDEAMAWLERAYEEHDQGMVYIKAYPGWDTLRSEPRFQALVRRMNFPQ